VARHTEQIRAMPIPGPPSPPPQVPRGQRVVVKGNCYNCGQKENFYKDCPHPRVPRNAGVQYQSDAKVGQSPTNRSSTSSLINHNVYLCLSIKRRV